jgi:hypothetical protein
VQRESGFDSRVLSARLVLINGEEVEQRFHKRTVSSDSSDSSLATTFNFEVEAALITANTRYSLELVECEQASGSQHVPRYPSGGSEDLQARDTGTLSIEYIPVVANGRTPSTDSGLLDAYRDYLALMYPVSAVNYSVGAPMTASTAITADGDGWDEALQQLSDRHMSDDAQNQVYYYGLLEPEASEDQYCSSGCVAGIGYITGPGACRWGGWQRRLAAER